MNVSFIGGGTMAEALIGGILDAKLTEAGNIRVGEPVESRRSYLEEKYGLNTTSSNGDVVGDYDILVMAVKPQSLGEVYAALNGSLPGDTAVVSIVAGANIASLSQGLGHPAIIRVMPNTPAQIGMGMCVWTAAPGVSKASIDATRDIVSTLGEEVYVPDEKLIDMATALSASGPAYVFLFIEAMIDAGVYLGMARDMARKLVLQTILGSTQMVKESGRHPADLKDMVTSPGGTTVEALLVMEKSGLRTSVLQGVIAAYEKSKALGG